MGDDNMGSSLGFLLFHIYPPAVGTRRTCSLEPPKRIDNKNAKATEKLVLCGQRTRNGQVKPSTRRRVLKSARSLRPLQAGPLSVEAPSPLQSWAPVQSHQPAAAADSKAPDLLNSCSSAGGPGSHLICLQQQRQSPRASQTPFHSEVPNQCLPAFQPVAEPGLIFHPSKVTQ